MGRDVHPQTGSDSKLMVLSQKSVLLVGHVTESYGPMQALPQYLAPRAGKLAVISHPFAFSGIPVSSCCYSSRGSAKVVLTRPRYSGPEVFRYLTGVLLTVHFALHLRTRFDLYIGSDCLNALAGLLLRAVGLAKKVVFYEYDYTPRRFQNRILNRVYHAINGIAARYSDMVWDNPPNLGHARASQGVRPERNIRVPHGVDVHEVPSPAADRIRREVLAYTGHVTEPHGLQAVVEAIPDVVQHVPQVEVWILGSGPFEATLREMVEARGMSDRFRFMGFTTHTNTLQTLPYCGIGLATYMDDVNGTFKHAEPLKVKDYLACGLPVLITRVPSIAGTIESEGLGLAVSYDRSDVSAALIKLLTDDDFYRRCRRNVSRHRSTISWTYTYDHALNVTAQRLGWF